MMMVVVVVMCDKRGPVTLRCAAFGQRGRVKWADPYRWIAYDKEAQSESTYVLTPLRSAIAL